MCGYLSESYFKVAHEDLEKARLKLTAIIEYSNTVDHRLKTTKVSVPCWLGLRHKTMSQHDHVVREMHGWCWFHDVALHFGYITEEEHRFCELTYRIPTLHDLDLWKKANEIFLTESDWRKVMACLEWRGNE